MLMLIQFKEKNQSIKWDTFVGRKGGMNNTLAPLKPAVTTLPSSQPPELNRSQKLEPIHPGKQNDSVPLSKTEISLPPTLEKSLDTASEHIDFKELLKGKPIIFVGGGPGLYQQSFVKLMRCCFSSIIDFQAVAKEHNVKK